MVIFEKSPIAKASQKTARMSQENNELFQKALDYGVIVSNDSKKTRDMLAEADKVWETALKESATLSNRMNGDIIDPSHISDSRITEIDHTGKEQQRPIIDLVQQGGGMFGIALLGYTYIMEKVGIRFHSYGGTSAGAINAAFLAAVPNTVYQKESLLNSGKSTRQTTKSEVLTHIIANTDFSTFMERGGIIGFLQEALFKNYRSWKLWLPLVLLSIVFLLGIYAMFSLIITTENGLTGTEIRVYDFIIGTFNVFAFALFCYFLVLRALGRNFGLNSGDVYYNWVDTLMHLFEIHNTKELNSRLKESIDITDKKGKKQSTNPRLVLMSANLTHNKVVKLPEEAGDYWINPWNVKPAAYLRATMSLPFIFEVLIPDMKHYDIIEKTNRVSTVATFVDGGLLSNFPIREFHGIDGETAGFPTFGVLLSSRENPHNEGRKYTFWRFIGSFLKTFKNFYDNDYLIRNKETEFLVELVNTKDYNWMNFWMNDADKRGLFKQGALAAINQLEKFDWQEYSIERKKEETHTKF